MKITVKPQSEGITVTPKYEPDHMDSFPTAQYTLLHIPRILIDDINSMLYKMDPYSCERLFHPTKSSFIFTFGEWPNHHHRRHYHHGLSTTITDV
jgi:hypothetical protein